MDRFQRDLKYNGCDPGDDAKADMAQTTLLIYAGPEIHDTLPDPI